MCHCAVSRCNCVEDFRHIALYDEECCKCDISVPEPELALPRGSHSDIIALADLPHLHSTLAVALALFVSAFSYILVEKVTVPVHVWGLASGILAVIQALLTYSDT